jgi:uncharacterized membrane protein YphA (DoxX/SURF4 family)
MLLLHGGIQGLLFCRKVCPAGKTQDTRQLQERALRSMRVSRWLIICCRVILSAVFIYAAIGKIIHPKEFADSVAAFRILPIVAVNIFAIVLPWVELLAGLFLLSGLLVRSSALLLIVLNVAFMVAVGSAIARGLDIECGCFTLSKAHDKVGWAIIARDIIFLMLCITIVVARDKKHAIVQSEHIAEEPMPEDNLLLLK